MTDSHDANAWETASGTVREDWPLRPIVLGAIGLATGLAVHFLVKDQSFRTTELSALRLAELAALLVAAGMFGFTAERRSWLAPLGFALVAGAVAAGVVYWNGEPDAWSGGDGWRMLSLFLALAIAAPLFQAARDAYPAAETRLPYASVHDHAWTNVVLWFACWVFVGIVFALMWLLAALFDLIEVEFLRRLLEKQWFGLSLAGLAFGAALGLLREHDAVVRLLHRVVASVLAVLAPVLGIGLAAFLLLLPFTGLGALWKSWVSTTPLLLVCVVGAMVLANAVIGNARDHESKLSALRIGAMLLAVVMLPLALLAAVATGLRIDQYGFTPERLWALTFVIIATAYGLAYFVSLVRGWMGWAAYVRPANLNLAIGLCLVALLLATPLISFNTISTDDQVARLESGKVAPDKFDWAALAYDFGEPGKAALRRLRASKNAAIAKRANEVATSKDRWEIRNNDREAENREKLTRNLRLLPTGTVLPDGLRDKISQDGFTCLGQDSCTLVFLTGTREAILFQDACIAQATAVPAKAEPPARGGPVSTVVAGCLNASRFVMTDGKWDTPDYPTKLGDERQRSAAAAGYKAGQIEVRTVPARQVFIGGVPVGWPFE
jgi:hypothetical protein